MTVAKQNTGAGWTTIGAPAPGYVMGDPETVFWQGQAALLDPDAYEWVAGANITRTVPAGEGWFLVGGWFVQATGGGLSLFQRHVHYEAALPMAEGKSWTTDASNAASYLYLCKPANVIGGDSRYTEDPRALYYERVARLRTELEQFTLGAVDTGSVSGGVGASFPTDFTDGMLLHTTYHDVAWTGLYEPISGAVMALLDEISDTNRARFAEATICPFKRTTFTGVRVRGATQSEGRGMVVYCKLPGDW